MLSISSDATLSQQSCSTDHRPWAIFWSHQLHGSRDRCPVLDRSLCPCRLFALSNCQVLQHVHRRWPLAYNIPMAFVIRKFFSQAGFHHQIAAVEAKTPSGRRTTTMLFHPGIAIVFAAPPPPPPLPITNCHLYRTARKLTAMMTTMTKAIASEIGDEFVVLAT